jgi:hypothetical protein
MRMVDVQTGYLLSTTLKRSCLSQIAHCIVSEIKLFFMISTCWNLVCFQSLMLMFLIRVPQEFTSMDNIVLHTIQLVQHCKTLHSMIKAAELSVSFYNFKIVC